MIPISTVKLGPEEEELILEVLRSGQLAQGVYVERFEEQFAYLHGVKHAVAVNNGTTALVVAMKALGIGPGDEVVTSPFTFVATLNAILEVGATARFADIGADFNVLPNTMDALINKRTKALVPVHLYGYMADMDPIMSMAEEHNLRVVEDAAQAVGADYKGKRAGSYDVGCFSLYATKNLSTGEGGIVTTDDDLVADKVRLLRNQGMRQRYQYEVAGHNYRLTNLAAAVGLPQLGRIEKTTAQRQTNARVLRDGLLGISGLEMPEEPLPDRSHVFHQFTVRVTESSPTNRDRAVEELVQKGVGAGIYYPKVVYDYDCYRNDPHVIKDSVPNAFAIASQVFSLPVHPFLTSDDLTKIIEAVREVFCA